MNTENKKDSFEEILEILNGYEEGLQPRSLEEFQCSCGGH